MILSHTSNAMQLDNRMEKAREEFIRSYRTSPDLPCGFSFGSVDMDPHGVLTSSQLVSLADQRMYNYKIEHKYRGVYSSSRRNSDFDLDYGITGKLFDILSTVEENSYIYLCNLNVNISRWSKNAVRDFGLSGAYLYDAAQEWAEHIHPDDRQAYLDDLEAVMSGKKDRHEMSYRARCANGRYVRCTCTGMVEKGVGIEPDIFAGSITRHEPIWDEGEEPQDEE